MGISAATIAASAAVASAGIGAFGMIQQGQAASAAGKYNAEVAANNAKIATQNANFASAEGEANAAAKDMETRQKVGAIKAAQSANDIDVNTGSALDVRASAAELGELDATNIRANAARKAYGYQTDAVSDNAKSELDKSQAGSASTAGYIGAGSTILGAVGNNWGSFTNSKATFSTADIGGGSINYGSEASN